MYKKHHTIEEIITAVRNNSGFLTRAAKDLGIGYQAIWKRLQKSQELRDAINAINEEHLDNSEDKLLNAIKEGELAAIFFHLKTKGKHRGYIEKGEVDFKGLLKHSGDIKIELTKEKKEELLQGAVERYFERLRIPVIKN